MMKFLKKYIDPWVPLYAIVPLAICCLFNSVVYYGTMYFSKYRTVFFDFTTAFDELIPVMPLSIFIYGSCYVFWTLNYLLIARIGKAELYRLCGADLCAKLVCLALFLFLPTTNVRPELSDTSISTMLLQFVYTMDQPVNLLPSIHCLTSWFCFIGMRGKTSIPRWYRVFSCVFALLICISTLLTKQHVIVDVVVGVGLAELTFFLCGRPGISKRLYRMFTKTDLDIRSLSPVA